MKDIFLQNNHFSFWYSLRVLLLFFIKEKFEKFFYHLSFSANNK